MTFRDFFHGYGEVDIKDQFVSARIVTDTLKRNFKITVLEESPHHMKCKINRFARLYAIPVLFPNPTIDITWENRTEGFLINYSLTCYDYYILIVGVFIAGISCGVLENTLWESLKMGLGFGAAALLFFGSLVFMDTKFLAHRIRKTLSKISELAHG